MQSVRSGGHWFKVTLFISGLAGGVILGNNPDWQQDVHYQMDVRLESETQTLDATSNITYTNHSPDTLKSIYMHLYPRAFRYNSVKHREFRHRLGRLSRAMGFLNNLDPYYWDLKIESFKMTTGAQDRKSYYDIEDTILRSDLDKPLAPGDSLIIKMEWTLVVGKMFERAGYLEDQFNMAQWYPKMVVYDEKGWHPDPFHAEGEFYGEFGTFDVTIDVPQRYIIGATGIVVDGNPGWEAVRIDTSENWEEWESNHPLPEFDSTDTSRRIVTFHAENVHDFAWVASPQFVYEYGQWGGIDLHVLYNRRNGAAWHREVMKRTIRSMAWLSNRFGHYPWPQFTVTDRLRGGGMEYPMLVMDGSDRESLIVHEMGHNWFYGLFGNNELDEAWLDEGFTTFQTRWYMEHYYPPAGRDFTRSRYNQPHRLRYWKYHSLSEDDQWDVIELMTSGSDEPVSRKAYLYKSVSVANGNVYRKASIMLDELRYVLGDSLFLAGMQTYYDRWHLKHVNEDRFIASMEAVTGEDLDWFFDPWLHDVRLLDFAVKSWSHRKVANGDYEVTLVLKQKGERFLPLDIETRLADGSRVRQRWTDHPWRYSDTLFYFVPQKPLDVVLDPDIRTVDVDRRNNYARRFPREIIFDWPRMSYNPRDRYLIKWRPLLHFQNRDGWMPGFRFSRSYGPWEKTDVAITIAPETGRFYWSVSGWRKPVHMLQQMKWQGFAYHWGGVAGIGASLHRNWSRQYRYPPNLQWATGFYVNNAKDTTRTDLFDPGTVTVLYATYELEMYGNTLGVEVSAAPAGWSDWSFSRISLTQKISMNQGRFHIGVRTLAGAMWSSQGGIPGQERFTVEGAGSGALYQHAYLRDESGLYGLTTLREHYHLTGDMNLRGFYDYGFAGPEMALANTVEISRPLSRVNRDAFVVLFNDVGALWGSKFIAGDEGFDGDILSDAGFGIGISSSWWDFPLRLRVDFPWLLMQSDPVNSDKLFTLDTQRWVFGFQASL